MRTANVDAKPTRAALCARFCCGPSDLWNGMSAVTLQGAPRFWHFLTLPSTPWLLAWTADCAMENMHAGEKPTSTVALLLQYSTVRRRSGKNRASKQNDDGEGRSSAN